MRYSLNQEFKITDENARAVKDIKIHIYGIEDGVENEKMEALFKECATVFVEYLQTEGKTETDNCWNDLETMFSGCSEKENKRKGLRGWF